ncbi:hypothetical protein KCU87_g258, partial [Aureobasidium melanogenum]
MADKEVAASPVARTPFSSSYRRLGGYGEMLGRREETSTKEETGGHQRGMQFQNTKFHSSLSVVSRNCF